MSLLLTVLCGASAATAFECHHRPLAAGPASVSALGAHGGGHDGVGGAAATRRSVGSALLGVGSLAVGGRARALNPMTDKVKRSRDDGGFSYAEPQAYLNEPTAEFKAGEAARADFRKRQTAYRATWDTAFGAFRDAKDDPARIAGLRQLSKLVLANGGLPSGLKLTDLITLCRRVRRAASEAGQWETPAQIAYMDLVRDIKAAENPDKEKDENYL